MHERPLPRISGLGEHCEIPERAAADMARYMGSTASVSDILQKLTGIFGMVALFDVLMQNFYKVTQGNHKKCPLCHKARGDFEPNSVKMPQMDSQLRGVIAPQGSSFLQGPQTYQGFYQVFV